MDECFKAGADLGFFEGGAKTQLWFSKAGCLGAQPYIGCWVFEVLKSKV